jgi:hypothetical protein
VKRVNAEAPMQLRLLCTLTADWPENFKPCSSDLYMELAHDKDGDSVHSPLNTYPV